MLKLCYLNASKAAIEKAFKCSSFETPVRGDVSSRGITAGRRVPIRTGTPGSAK